jgi:DNA-binding PadR family transcriptional regulator
MSSNMSLEDVLDALMLEEPKPAYAALLRWSERYPQHRDALTRFFATWAIQAGRPEEPDLSEEQQKRLVDGGVRYALELAREQGRVALTRPVEPLRPIDQLVLTAIYLLRDEAWSGRIVEKMCEMSGANVQFGPVFSSLQRLQDRNLVSVRHVHLETQPADRSRRYFTVTRAGDRTLAEAQETAKVVADFLAEFA